jgi:alpha-tubulin suppressor-like RCC1 family protein
MNSLNSANSCQICAPLISTSAWYQPPSDCATIAAHDYFTCGVAGGVAKCWGSNGSGRGESPSLGTGETYDQLAGSPVPLMVTGLGGSVQAVSTGPDSYHACAVVNGGVKCWGDGRSGQLGDGSTTSSSDIPVQVAGLTSGVQGIATGVSHSCALVNGRVECWGDNSFGQLGTAFSSMTPATPVISNAQAISLGAYHSCALINGSVWCWGSNSNGQLGNNSTTDSDVPVQVTTLGSDVQVIAAGGNSTCAISEGELYCWGANGFGQLGDGTSSDRAVPVAVQTLTSDVQAVATSSAVTCAIFNGGAWCWGAGVLLGDGSSASRATPGPVPGLDSGVLAITVGSAPCALTSAGAKCWGDNSEGELGANSTAASSPTPVSVQGL